VFTIEEFGWGASDEELGISESYRLETRLGLGFRECRLLVG